MKTFVDSKGRVHRQRPDGLWVVRCPLAGRTLFLPALRETGGGTEGNYYATSNDAYGNSGGYGEDDQWPDVNWTDVWAGAGPLVTLTFYAAHPTLLVAQSAYQLEGPPLSSSMACRRSIFPFATDALPADAVVTEASMMLYINQKYTEGDSNYDIVAVSYTGNVPPSTLADWGGFGSTSLGEVGKANITASTYLELPLLEGGIALIQPGAISVFGLRLSQDIDSQGTGSPGYVGVLIASSQDPSENYPYLLVGYTSAGGAVHSGSIGSPLIF